MSSVIRFLVGFAMCSLAGWGCAQSSPSPAPLRVISFDGGFLSIVSLERAATKR